MTEALDCESETQVLVPALRLAIRVTRLTLEALVSSPGRQRGQIREKSHGWRSLVGFSPWGREESDKTEQLHFHFSLSCIGEGNGNPLQCSCLENPRDGGAWWAAVSGVAQSQTRLKRLSSSSRVGKAVRRKPCLGTHQPKGTISPPVMAAIQVGEDPVFVLQRAK